MAKCLRVYFLVCVACLVAGTFAFSDDRIVGGRPAEINEFPYQVSLRRSFNDNHFCGGSLIGPCHILTAAHCMFYVWGGILPPIVVSVVGGQNDLKLNENSMWRNASKLYVHEEFDNSMKSNDIAIVELSKCFPLDSEKVAIAALSTRTPRPGTTCTVSGWGVTKFGDQKPWKELLAANVSVIDESTCQSKYDKANVKLSPGMMCAGLPDGSKDACQGDSGGPLFCNYMLSGIVSTAIGCANPDYPGIYTDIAKYLTWIQNILDGKHNKWFYRF